MSKRVLIGMSGGIDSTVAAILLLEQGYELVGATFRTFDSIKESCLAKEKGCCSVESIMEAQRMAATLGFEHHILDFRDTFREHVIGNFVSEYARGRTPNPCVLCNSHIKWGKLMQAAEQYGCDYIATGHYAQIAEHRGHMYLKTAVDTHKDQTYFLWMLTEENLRHTLFPLGGLTKTQVRQIALDHGFEALSKKAESQDICFIPNNDYRSFLAQHGVSVPQGEYVDAQGKILGMHQGYCHYTIGQRKGLGIALGAPKFVTKIDAENNRVTLGDRDDLLTTQATIADVRIRDWDWLQESPQVQARIRYKSPAVPAHLSPIVNTQLPISNSQLPIANTQLPIANTPTLPEGVSITFSTPVWGVTPGQSLVMYKDNLVVGGGIIQ
ncbi:MAG: tRNA 2-thiouridine(34) synthase MnmA [Paludibacteraceae bacterium]|nr:tRNA 2-thiouridine(34) synthase MnmA [Paludibacteraceae bacterium]MBO5012631.1 tRNA 2-thiouridine(34) synthase MnmA [Paludibacteraceae bacterium]